MEDQLVEYIVLGLVLFSCLVFISRATWRKFGPNAGLGCGGGCGCSDAADNSDASCAPTQGST